MTASWGEITRHMRCYPRGPEGVLITNRIRKIPRRSSFGDCWREAVEKAGLRKGTRFHDLRHYYASTLIAANLNPKSIQRRLGHATIAETFDTYGRLYPHPLVRGVEVTSRPVGRVLSFVAEGATIHLGPPLPAASSGLPARLGRAALERRARDAPESVPS